MYLYQIYSKDQNTSRIIKTNVHANSKTAAYQKWMIAGGSNFIKIEFVA